jgi:hypothetical protein
MVVRQRQRNPVQAGVYLVDAGDRPVRRRVIVVQPDHGRLPVVGVSPKLAVLILRIIY